MREPSPDILAQMGPNEALKPSAASLHDFYPVGLMPEVLEGSVRRCDYFASDETDEFQIRREDGSDQGIFKVWATPIIPVLETGQLDVGSALEAWNSRMNDRPLSLFESLEQWRAFSAVQDRRLQQVFESRDLPTDPQEAIAEQFCRLQLAFAYGAPFYNLEALVADSRADRSGNPIDFSEEHTTGGTLDAVAMLLPSALREHVTADRLDWNGLNWEELQERIATLRAGFENNPNSIEGRQFIQIHKIAALANVEPDEILFAANALQFIPADVGGKRDDLQQTEALDTLDILLDTSSNSITTGSVAKDANALIRFLNWTPAIKSDENFTGKYWTYDAVCRTAADLVETIKKNPEAAFDPAFAAIFTEHLAPQLDGLDAASAKGRFMLQLHMEGKFNSTASAAIEQHSSLATPETLASLAQISAAESLVDIGCSAPTLLVGGKATGLRRAIQLFGKENVLPGQVITTEAVSSWLDRIETLQELTQELESASSPEDKVAIGEHITRLIHESAVPAEVIAKIQSSFAPGARIVLRSSSFDEDVDIIGPAPGVYESVVNISSDDPGAIEVGFKETVSSFFSDKAISFRELKGLRHTPLFAVLAQEFQPGVGGSVFIQNGTITLNTAPSPEQINDIAAAGSIEELTFSHDSPLADIQSSRLTQEQVGQIAGMAGLAEAIYGPSDMEFVIDPNTQRIRLLQMRSLERPSMHDDNLEFTEPEYILPIDNLDALPELNGHGSVGLIIAEDIDLEKFQGSLFRWIITNRDRIQAVTLANNIPTTCHFANIMESLGIRIRSAAN